MLGLYLSYEKKSYSRKPLIVHELVEQMVSLPFHEKVVKSLFLH